MNQEEHPQQTRYQKYRDTIIKCQKRWLEKDENKQKKREWNRAANKKRNEKISKMMQEYEGLKQQVKELSALQN